MCLAVFHSSITIAILNIAVARSVAFQVGYLSILVFCGRFSRAITFVVLVPYLLLCTCCSKVKIRLVLFHRYFVCWLLNVFPAACP
jgi:hypothetical protein